MTFAEIRSLPTVLETAQLREDLKQPAGRGYHESLLRAFNILEKVKDLLELNTPPSVVLEIIYDLEGPRECKADESLIIPPNPAYSRPEDFIRIP